MDANRVNEVGEMTDWPFELRRPVRIADADNQRDGGVQGGTYIVYLEDADGRSIPFFFDNFLGRLCYGSRGPESDDAAFLKKGSRIQVEALALIAELAPGVGDEYGRLAERLKRARRWM